MACREPFVGICRVINGIDVYTGAYTRKISDGNAVAIKKRTVHIDFDPFSKENVFAVINKKRCSNPHVLTSLAEKLVKYGGQFLFQSGRGVVVFRLQLLGLVPPFEQFGIATVV